MMYIGAPRVRKTIRWYQNEFEKKELPLPPFPNPTFWVNDPSWIFVSVVSQNLVPEDLPLCCAKSTRSHERFPSSLPRTPRGVSFCYPNKLHWALQENMAVIGFNSVKLHPCTKPTAVWKMFGTFYADRRERSIPISIWFEMGGGDRIWTRKLRMTHPFWLWVIKPVCASTFCWVWRNHLMILQFLSQ